MSYRIEVRKMRWKTGLVSYPSDFKGFVSRRLPAMDGQPGSPDLTTKVIPGNGWNGKFRRETRHYGATAGKP